MSDDWQVKEVKKSGDGFWINVQPTYQGGGEAGPAHLFNIIIMSMVFMSWFGISGFWGWAICATIACVITAFLYVPSLIFSLVTVIYFLFW
jgi:hypothetical protein